MGQAETPSPDPNGEDFCGFGSQLVCRPFIWQNGAMAALPLLTGQFGPGGRNGAASAINNRGQIAGMSETAELDPTCPPVDPALSQFQKYRFKPVLWENGQVRELPTIGGDSSGIAVSINNRGQAVGGTGSCTSFQANGNLTYLYSLHATLWEDGKVIDLGNLGGIGAGGGNLAVAINDRGQVVGASGTPDGLFHGFLWSKETGIQDLGAIEGDIASVALGINEAGEVVGLSFDPYFTPRAFLRRNGGEPVDLNSLVSGGAPLFLFHAVSINGGGEIVGMAVNAEGEIRGYLAVPNEGHETAPDALQAAPGADGFGHARKLLRERLGLGRPGARPVAPR